MVELLAPAGDFEKLKTALYFGADAVYLDGKEFGMRAFAGNFPAEKLQPAVDFAHSHGVRVHCTINTMPRNDEIARLPEHLARLHDAGVDALIVADIGEGDGGGGGRAWGGRRDERPAFPFTYPYSFTRDGLQRI